MEFSARITPFMPLADARFLGESASVRRGCAYAECAEFLARAEFFSSGRDALLRAIKLSRLQGKTLWLPHYFCPWVVKSAETFAANEGARVRFYAAYPTTGAEFETLTEAATGDAVVAVDFFGTGFGGWGEWKRANADVLLLADASHAPFAAWAREIGADFVFASLRKTLPVPDGGFLFSPERNPNKMYRDFGEIAEFAAVYSLAAAMAQVDYERAEDFYYNAEMRLNAKRGISRMSFYTHNILKMFDLQSLWQARKSAVCAFEKAVGGAENFGLLQSGVEKLDALSVFCPTLVFGDVRARDRAYAALGRAGVLASIYWGAKFLKDTRAKSESAGLMTIPLDFRHTCADAEKIADILLNA